MKGNIDTDCNIIGTGEIHCTYHVEDFSGLPIVSTIQEALSTESVYVKYRRTDGKDLRFDDDNLYGYINVRFSSHNCNAIKFGMYIDGRNPNSRNEILYRLGFIDRELVPVKAPYIPYVEMKMSKVKNLEVTPLTHDELLKMPIGTDLTKYKGMLIKGTRNRVITGDKVVEQTIRHKYVYGTLNT